MAAALSAALVTAACGDDFEPGPGEWDVRVDTVTLYTVDRAEYQGLPAAYDVHGATAVRLEDSGTGGSWDVVLRGGVGGQPLTLEPLGAFFDFESRAGVAGVSGEFLSFERAPTATDRYATDEAIDLQADTLYVVRSREIGVSGIACFRFAKLEPLEIDEAAGTFRFRAVANPFCNDYALVPPEED